MEGYYSAEQDELMKQTNPSRQLIFSYYKGGTIVFAACLLAHGVVAEPTGYYQPAVNYEGFYLWLKY